MKTLTRREALLRMFKVVTAVGAAGFISFDDLLTAAQFKNKRPAVIWLHGSGCSGCSGSLLDIEDVSAVDLITRFVELVFHPDLSSATGHQVPDIIESLISSRRGFIFVFEGGIPAGMPHACMFAGKPIAEWAEMLSKRALACIAAGTCATFGGVTKMEGMVTGSMGLSEYLKSRNISTPVLNLPNCPMKPEHFAYTALHFIKLGRLPVMDSCGCPLHFFEKTNHERCIYYSDFQENNFAEFIGDKGCMFHLGCQGPITYNDCLVNGHNNNTNTCIRAGHPCIGCAGAQFPRTFMFHRYNDPRTRDKKSV